MSVKDLTTFMDLLGLLLLVAGACVWVWLLLGCAAGLGVAGLGLLGVSWLVDRRGKR
jgi:hypothetical protein